MGRWKGGLRRRGYIYTHIAQKLTQHCKAMILHLKKKKKESACNAGDPGSIPGSGRAPGVRNDNRLQYSCLENSMGRGGWQATVHGTAKSWT